MAFRFTIKEVSLKDTIGSRPTPSPASMELLFFVDPHAEALKSIHLIGGDFCVIGSAYVPLSEHFLAVRCSYTSTSKHRVKQLATMRRAKGM